MLPDQRRTGAERLRLDPDAEKHIHRVDLLGQPPKPVRKTLMVHTVPVAAALRPVIVGIRVTEPARVQRAQRHTELLCGPRILQKDRLVDLDVLIRPPVIPLHRRHRNAARRHPVRFEPVGNPAAERVHAARIRSEQQHGKLDALPRLQRSAEYFRREDKVHAAVSVKFHAPVSGPAHGSAARRAVLLQDVQERTVSVAAPPLCGADRKRPRSVVPLRGKLSSPLAAERKNPAVFRQIVAHMNPDALKIPRLRVMVGQRRANHGKPGFFGKLPLHMKKFFHTFSCPSRGCSLR